MIERRALQRIQRDLKRYDESREKVLGLSRVVTRLSGWSIIQTHRKEMKKAAATLREAERSLKQMSTALQRYPELKGSGSIRVAEQEYTEARCLHALVADHGLPSITKVGVEPSSYLLGLLDMIGELRRLALNYLRNGRGVEAERTLVTMEDLYEDLLSLDHTAIIPTFRNKADGVRRVIESTRGDVVTEIRRLSLEKAIRDLERSVR